MTRRAIVAGTLAVLTLAGCGTAPVGVAGRQRPVVSTPMPPGVSISATATAEEVPPCEPRKSLRPLRPMPAPGAMPAGSTMAKILERGRLTIGVGPNAYRLSYRDPNTGQVRGFEADIASAIAEAIFGDPNPERIQWRALNTADRIAAVKGPKDAGELASSHLQEEAVEPVDMVLAAMTMTCGRRKDVAFSAEYYQAGQQVLVRRDDPAVDLAGLAGRKVCASATSTNLLVIAQATPKVVPVSAANTSDCLVLLLQGQVDAVSTGDVILAGLKAQEPGTKIVGGRFTDEPTGIAMSQKAPDLVRFVNGVLEQFISSGEWQTSQRFWLDPYLTEKGPAPPVPQYSD